jgi:hypothetical protein
VMIERVPFCYGEPNNGIMSAPCGLHKVQEDAVHVVPIVNAS